MLLWDPRQHTDEDNLRWSWLRAVEWGRWPLFVSQPIAPILFLFFPWYWVAIGAFLVNLLWAAIRYAFVDAGLASIGALLVLLKWPVCIGMGIVFACKGDYPSAAISALWPIVVIPLGLFTPTMIGPLQEKFMRILGYEKRE